MQDTSKNSLESKFQSNNIENTIIVFSIFILPHTIYSIIPESFNFLFFVILTCFYIGLIVYNFSRMLEYIQLLPLLISLAFVFFGVINILYHGYFSYFNLLSPIIAYIGYMFYLKKKINLNFFLYTFFILYIYYIFIYYSILPDFFFRPNFDEDAAVFDNASSNAIPISLNITLYFYILLNRYWKAKHEKKIILLATLNLVAIIIQQSRGGLLIAFILLGISFFDHFRKYAWRFFFLSIVFLSLFISLNYQMFIEYFDLLGNINGLYALDEDVRGIAQSEFFNKLTFSNWFFGYPPNTIYVVWSDTDIKYTYNVLLDIWNKYTISLVVGLLLLIVFRICASSKFEFPIYYLLPFILYSLIESLFFPNFWDAFIYFLLFLPKKKNIECFNLINNAQKN